MRPRAPTDPARYAQQLLGLLESWGIDRAKVLHAACTDAARFARVRGDERLTMDQADTLFGAARTLSGRSDFGFESGLGLKPVSHGLFGDGLIGCADVDAAWQRAARQQHRRTGAFLLRYEKHALGARAWFTPVMPIPPERLQFNLETLAVWTHVAMHMLLGERLPTFDVRLSMPAPAHARRCRDLRSTRFHFDAGDAPGVMVAMDRHMLPLPLPLPMAAPDVVNGVEGHLGARVPRGARHPAGSQIVAQRLGCNDAANVSRALRRRAGMSPSEFRALMAGSACVPPAAAARRAVHRT